MKKTAELEEIITKVQNGEKVDMKEAGVNHTLFRAYMDTLRSGNEAIDFNDVIWDRDIEEIAEQLRKFGITEFTISSTFSGLIETIAAFAGYGIRMDGLTEINATYTDFFGNSLKRIPAFRMIVE